MPRIVASNVRETTTVTGTGAATLLGVRAPGRTFSTVMAVGDTCYYGIFHTTLNEWEIGLGTYSGANTLTRTTPLESSNGGGAVNFSAGTKNVDIVNPSAEVLGPPINVFANNLNEPIQVQSFTTGHMVLFPIGYGGAFPGRMTADSMRVGISGSFGTTTSSNSWGSTFRVGLYSLNNSTQLTLINSASCVVSAAAVATSSMSAMVNGPRFVELVSSQWSSQPAFSNDGQYFVGLCVSQAGQSRPASYQVISVGRTGASGFFGITNTNATSHKFDYFHGVVSTASPPNSVAHSNVLCTNVYGAVRPVIMFAQGIQTA